MPDRGSVSGVASDRCSAWRRAAFLLQSACAQSHRHGQERGRASRNATTSQLEQLRSRLAARSISHNKTSTRLEAHLQRVLCRGRYVRCFGKAAARRRCAVDESVRCRPRKRAITCRCVGRSRAAITCCVRASERRALSSHCSRPDRRLPAETAPKRLTCDATTTTVLYDKDGAIIDVGRKTRRISSKLRLALTQRDQGCRFPGCSNKFTDAHHLKHWSNGGQTRLKNLMLLCGFHHGFIHDGKALLGEDQIFPPLKARLRLCALGAVLADF